MNWEPFLKNIRDVDKPLLTNLYNELAEFLMHHDGVVNADIGTDIVLFAAVRRLFALVSGISSVHPANSPATASITTIHL